MNTKEEKAKQRFLKAAKELQASVLAAQEIWPGAELYLASSTLNLMSGPHHEGNHATARPDRVLESYRIPEIDGGDW